MEACYFELSLSGYEGRQRPVCVQAPEHIKQMESEARPVLDDLLKYHIEEIGVIQRAAKKKW